MSNDHYVPQHYLRAWAFDPDRRKLHAYKRVAQTGTDEFKKRSIKRTASASNLNMVTTADGQSFSFETSVMTEQVDTPFSIVLEDLRKNGLSNITAPKKAHLARFIVTLEGRNPAVFEQMKLGPEHINEIMSPIAGSASSKKEVGDLFKSFGTSSGAVSGGLYSSWGHCPDATSLTKRVWLEVTLSSGREFVASDYPVGRVGDYESSQCVTCLPISPNKAVLIASQEFIKAFASHPPIVAHRFVDLLTLARASSAYAKSEIPDPFVFLHLGWVSRHSGVEMRNYIGEAMKQV